LWTLKDKRELDIERELTLEIATGPEGVCSGWEAKQLPSYGGGYHVLLCLSLADSNAFGYSIILSRLGSIHALFHFVLHCC